MRVYEVNFKHVAVSAIQDFFEINAPSSGAVEILEAAITDDDGEISEQGYASWVRGHTTSGSGGTTPTAVPIGGSLDTAFAGTVEANNTTIASAGTTVTISPEGFNFVGQGYRHQPVPEARIVVAPSARLVLRLAAAPGAARNLSGYCKFRVIGG